MILYHGSNQQVIIPDLLRSRPGKDFGQAFYLSEDRNQAEEMADFKVKTSNLNHTHANGRTSFLPTVSLKKAGAYTTLT